MAWPHGVGASADRAARLGVVGFAGFLAALGFVVDLQDFSLVGQAVDAGDDGGGAGKQRVPQSEGPGRRRGCQRESDGVAGGLLASPCPSCSACQKSDFTCSYRSREYTSPQSGSFSPRRLRSGKTVSSGGLSIWLASSIAKQRYK